MDSVSRLIIQTYPLNSMTLAN